MASGRMEFHAQSIMQHANFCYVLPNDVEMPEVIDPRHYERPTKSLILLHGLTGTDTDWLYGGVAQEMAIQYNLAVFMPTGGNYFYLDRGYPGGNYAAFVGQELPDYIHKVFGYCESREDTLVAGLSMGGYGAICTALRFPARFGACIALSSALRIRAIAAGETEEPMSPALLRDVFGDPGKLLGSDKDPEELFRRLKAAGGPVPGMYLACGTEDSLLEANRSYRDFLRAEGAEVCWEEGPGGHNWRFWNEYVNRGLGHFLNRFEAPESEKPADWLVRDREIQAQLDRMRGEGGCADETAQDFTRLEAAIAAARRKSGGAKD